MAGLDDWGSESEGAHQNNPNLSSKQFKPLPISRHKGEGWQPDVSPEDREQHIENATSAYDKASPIQKHNGAMFYPRGQGDSMRVGLGINPGVLKSEETPIGSMPSHVPGTRGQDPTAISAAHAGAARSGVPGATPTRQASAPRTSSDIPSSHGGPHRPGVVQHNVISAAIDRGAGAIAGTSPSSPAGMNYEHNPHAAWEALTVPPEHMEALRESEKNRSPKGEDDEDLSSPTRMNVVGGKSSLQHAGNNAILKAHDILSGRAAPEERLPMDIKTGSFYKNLRSGGKDEGATIDGRTHDLTLGPERYPWNTTRGLSSKARYGYFNDVQKAAGGRRSVSASTMQATGWIQDKGAMMEGKSEAEQAIGRGVKRTDR